MTSTTQAQSTRKTRYQTQTTVCTYHPAHLANSNPYNRGVVVSLFTGGAFFGAFFAGPAGDRLGRRWTIFLGSIIFIIGGVFQTAAQTIHWLWGGRAIAGLGVGFLVMIIPVYQGEIAHPSIRGRVTALQQFMLGIGSFIAGWLSYGTFSVPSSAAYRSMCSQSCPLLIVRTTTDQACSHSSVGNPDPPSRHPRRTHPLLPREPSLAHRPWPRRAGPTNTCKATLQRQHRGPMGQGRILPDRGSNRLRP